MHKYHSIYQHDIYLSWYQFLKKYYNIPLLRTKYYTVVNFKLKYFYKIKEHTHRDTHTQTPLVFIKKIPIYLIFFYEKELLLARTILSNPKSTLSYFERKYR